MKGRSIRMGRPLVIGMAFLGTVVTAFGFYDPAVQRWVNRDPIEENGGINLYSFVANMPSANYDAVGLAANPFCEAMEKQIKEAQARMEETWGLEFLYHALCDNPPHLHLSTPQA